MVMVIVIVMAMVALMVIKHGYARPRSMLLEPLCHGLGHDVFSFLQLYKILFQHDCVLHVFVFCISLSDIHWILHRSVCPKQGSGTENMFHLDISQ